MLPRRALILVTTIALGCGAEDLVAPYTAPAPACPEADDYLQPLYRLEAEGKIANLSTAIRDRISDSARRDLIDALLGLLGAFEDGDFSALRADAPPPDAPAQGLQVTLGRIVRWLVQTGPSAPNLPLTGLVRRVIATCEGAPVFALLADAIADPALLDALLATLGSDGLAAGLADLDFEGSNGREALAYLVRNLLVSASSDAFELDVVLDLLGLLVDLDAPPFADLAAGLERLLDADGLPRLRGLLVCLRQVDPELALGGFLYELLTSGLLADALPAATAGISSAWRELARKALDKLALDAEVRRGLSPTLLVLLADDLAPAVLGDVAELLSAEALSGVFDLVVELATRACRDAATRPTP